MAVEAHHLHFLPSLIRSNREICHSGENEQQMGFVLPSFDSSFLPVYNPTAVPTTAADSGLTFNDVVAGASPSRKRHRPICFLGDDAYSVSSHLQQQILDIDRLVVQHAEKVRAEVAEKRRRLTSQLLAVLEAGVAKRLKSKDEEIARLVKLNWALEERVKSLCVESQMWRGVAQSNEATSNELRSNLAQVLAAQARADLDAAATADDAESCCPGDENDNAAGQGEEQKAVAVDWATTACRLCRARQPSVLLLPCRHLSLCEVCAPAANACPICNCAKNGSVNVNLY
ncbi:probable BOI-related E3 ubiquitin-protein ligase 3 [Zingiber officinale]|uniref:probable BOI-related E3 ubiquitin-protein ligase 3 n=1 Tax=Zingiber officinale TaxID=94328 RepID=UPI001C4C47C3|nr:probable BOI-related E3 ubiquitin-protein ligase 3 [Zingiber officinale]